MRWRLSCASSSPSFLWQRSLSTLAPLSRHWMSFVVFTNIITITNNLTASPLDHPFSSPKRYDCLSESLWSFFCCSSLSSSRPSTPSVHSSVLLFAPSSLSSCPSHSIWSCTGRMCLCERGSCLLCSSSSLVFWVHLVLSGHSCLSISLALTRLCFFFYLPERWGIYWSCWALCVVLAELGVRNLCERS